MTTTSATPVLVSMTGFAATTGALDGWSWAADVRSVNGKGLDVRVRAPDWVEGLEPAVRKAVSQVARRGSVTLNIRVSREDVAGLPQVASAQLDAVLTALSEIEARAMDAGISLAPSTATQIAGLRGVLDVATPDSDTTALRAALMVDVEAMLAAFAKMRAAEGAALAQVLSAQLDEVAATLARAEDAVVRRAAKMKDTLSRNLARVLDAADTDPQRVAQELALIAVKADVTEEIDRLHTHIAAARTLISDGGAVGRKFDFLMQEFNREANTLCSKAQESELTQAGLDLKVLIDQMREQVQNVE